MSVKQIITAVTAVVILGGFTALAVYGAVKTDDKLDFQEASHELELQSKTSKIKELNVKYEKLNLKLDKAAKDKNTSEKQIEKLKQEMKELEAEKEVINQKLQAKIKRKNDIALAAASVSNAGAATAHASSGSCDQWIRQSGITHPIAYEIIGRENRGCNPCVYNDGSSTGAINCNYSGGNAYGIPQSKPGNKMASEGADWRTNPVTQLRWMQKYVMNRYGSWEVAKSHHDTYGWY